MPGRQAPGRAILHAGLRAGQLSTLALWSRGWIRPAESAPAIGGEN
jgi:hypothetical protein